MAVAGGDGDGARQAEEDRHDWRTTLIVALAVLALVHSLLVALWLAPRGPVRDVAGGSLLATYVDPYFRQSWDLLEPSAQRVDEALWVRARVRTGPETLALTPWLDVTKADLTRTRDDVAPARIHLAGRRLATNLNNAMFALGGSGRQVVLDSTVGRPPETLRAALASAGVRPADVAAYADLDTMATRFASLYTQAYTDRRVVQVQYRVARRTVPPHADRDEQRVSSVPFEWFDAGWRAAVRGSAEAQSAFDGYLGVDR
jgi:hypothetical protein